MYGNLHDDALLRDMIRDERRFSCELRSRRAQGISRCEPPDVLAFYDRLIAETDARIVSLLEQEQTKNR